MAAFADVARWTAGDGARLALRRQDVAGARRAACLLVHGFGDHSGRYAPLAQWLADRGIATWALDQRGHGHSPGPRGHVARFAQYLADIVALRKLIAAETPGPLVLLGQSHGGLVVLRYLETAPTGVTAAAVLSPYLALAMHAPRWKVLLAKAVADLLPALPIPTGMVLDHLCTDPAVVAAARADPLCHQVITPRAHHETVEAQTVLRREQDRIGIPVWFGLAGDDRIVSAAASEAFARSLTGDVTVNTYPGMFHEILNEPERDRVLADLGAFLDRVLGG